MAMDTSSTSGPRLPWAGKKVRTQYVEEELSLLWRMSADNMRIAQNIRVRTSILNFVICTSDIDSAQRAHTLMRDLSSTHLARVILLILDKNNSLPSGTSTWVTLRSFSILSDIMRHSFEQITVLASGSAAEDGANIIQPLLKPDLPVYLWWLNDVYNGASFTNLAQSSTRVIVDSNSFFTPEQSISELSSHLQTSPNCALSDLNWARLAPWQELVAQFFDVAEYRPYLQGVDSIEIEHAVAPFAEHIRTEQGEVSPNPTGALLLAGWLKTRLGWKLSFNRAHNQHDYTTGTHTWYMGHTTGALSLSADNPNINTASQFKRVPLASIHVRPCVQPALRPGSICLVRLNCNIENTRATFTIKREDDHDCVLTSVELDQGTQLRRAVSLTATQNKSELLHNELEIMSRDHIYEDTLYEVAELLEELE